MHQKYTLSIQIAPKEANLGKGNQKMKNKLSPYLKLSQFIKFIMDIVWSFMYVTTHLEKKKKDVK